MFTLTITWHLIMTIVVNIAIILGVMKWAEDNPLGCAFGMIVLAFVTALIWAIYGGIVWW
jgi:hypothetical protein